MAHWAQINEKNVVERIVVTKNDKDDGESWVRSNLKGVWLKTSYNTRLGKHLLGGTPFRKNFAQPGYVYNETLDAFVPPKVKGRESFVLDEESATWIPPVPFPDDATWLPDFQEKPAGHDDVEEKRIYIWSDENSEWQPVVELSGD